MMAAPRMTQIAIEIPSDLTTYTDQVLAGLWHVAQLNPAPIEDRQAGDLAERIGREIIRRWLRDTPPELYHHQGQHHYWWHLAIGADMRWNGSTWERTDAAKAVEPAHACPTCEDGECAVHSSTAAARFINETERLRATFRDLTDTPED